MSEEIPATEATQETEDHNEDAFADATSAILAVVIPVVAIVYWLSGLPTS